MAKKVYAVRKGKVTGLFSTWDECKEAITGFSGAEYRGFNSLDEAEAYLRGEAIAVSQNVRQVIQKPVSENEVQIYTDGSCKDGIISIGLCLRTYLKDLKFYGKFNTSAYNSLNNIAGETIAVLAGVELAIQLKLTNISIYYDYEGIEKWFTGDWSAKTDLSIKYVGLLRNLVGTNNLNIQFFKVVHHSGVEGNVIADKMASRARNFNETIDVAEILRGTLTIEKTPTYRGF